MKRTAVFCMCSFFLVLAFGCATHEVKIQEQGARLMTQSDLEELFSKELNVSWVTSRSSGTTTYYPDGTASLTWKGEAVVLIPELIGLKTTFTAGSGKPSTGAGRVVPGSIGWAKKNITLWVWIGRLQQKSMWNKRVQQGNYFGRQSATGFFGSKKITSTARFSSFWMPSFK